MPSMDAIPSEILTQILFNVKSTSRLSLKSYLLVDRRWRDIAAPLFYGTVVLSKNNVASFVRTCSIDCLPLIYSLTVRINSLTADGTADASWDEYHAAAVASSREVQELSRILPLMGNLATFSLFVEPRESFAILQRTITRRCIIRLLDSLPPSCIDIEIDTKSMECYEVIGLWDDGHLCEALCRVLPRARHVRIKIAAACSALVGEGPLLHWSESGALAQFRPISMPSLESFVINANLTVKGDRAALACNAGTHDWYPDYPQSALYRGLRQVAQKRGAVPSSTEVLMLVPCCINTDAKSWSGLACVRVSDETSLLTPFLSGEHLGDPKTAKRCLVRSGDEQISACQYFELEQCAEGELWRDFEGGERLPAAVSRNVEGFSRYVLACREAPRSATPAEEAYLLATEESVWRERLLAPRRVPGCAYVHQLHL
jgi:hypothetical protein